MKNHVLKDYVKTNFMNQHKIIDEVPISLLEEVNRLSTVYYKASTDKIEY